jgi:hypothetical protein
VDNGRRPQAIDSAKLEAQEEIALAIKSIAAVNQ